jgi:hypothetical protein
VEVTTTTTTTSTDANLGNLPVTVTAKFWYVSDFNGGDADYLANSYAEEKNLALARSNIPVTYIRWGLPKTQGKIDTKGPSHWDQHENFLNSFGDSYEETQYIK